MKHILIIDETTQFREFLRQKLTDNDIETTVAVSGLEGLAKLRSIEPDLVVMDYNLSRQGCMELLKQKKASPSLAPIPVIIIAQPLDQKRILELVSYNVKNVFTKPVNIDLFFATLSEMLGLVLKFDESPGIVEVHVNEDIIFVEITEGLNRDKLDLLYFKIIELIELYQIRVPKLIIMLSGISLSAADDFNIRRLLNNILQSSKAKQRNIRILTKDDFAKTFITNQKEYKDIEVVSTLKYALDGLLAELDNAENKIQEAVLIGDRVLTAGDTSGESMMLRFDGETKFTIEDVKDSLTGLRIAAVDDDDIIRELIKNTFNGFDIDLSLYADGAEFIAGMDKEKFDLIFLDLLMPRADGFAVLRELKDRGIETPVIVLSAINQRETVIRSFQMGIKSYLTKPLKPADIFKKALEILRVNF
ncbi:two-component system response regulator [Spirochaetia bacterium]|nr:two-component system response regulator [Spirochaetia bacterium]